MDAHATTFRKFWDGMQRDQIAPAVRSSYEHLPRLSVLPQLALPGRIESVLDDLREAGGLIDLGLAKHAELIAFELSAALGPLLNVARDYLSASYKRFGVIRRRGGPVEGWGRAGRLAGQQPRSQGRRRPSRAARPQAGA